MNELQKENDECPPSKRLRIESSSATEPKLANQIAVLNVLNIDNLSNANAAIERVQAVSKRKFGACRINLFRVFRNQPNYFKMETHCLSTILKRVANFYIVSVRQSNT